MDRPVFHCTVRTHAPIWIGSQRCIQKRLDVPAYFAERREKGPDLAEGNLSHPRIIPYFTELYASIR